MLSHKMRLGGFYELGLNGYPKDAEKALEWRLKAAQQGIYFSSV